MYQCSQTSLNQLKLEIKINNYSAHYNLSVHLKFVMLYFFVLFLSLLG